MSAPHPLRLFLVRHGEVAANRELRYVGSDDQPLTPLGEQQAAAVAAALAELDLDTVISSPLSRARATAAKIAAARGLESVLDDRLREQSFGDWEGLSRAEVLEREPERLARWESDPSVAPPGGESQVSVQARVLDLVHELHEGAGNREQPLQAVLVSHVGPIKAMLAAALDVPVASARRLFLDPATVSVVDWGDPPLVRLCNSHAHLGWRNARWMA